MARNPDGTFQQGDPETRQAAQKGGQASHGSQRQNQNNQNKPNEQKPPAESETKARGRSGGAPPKSLEDSLKKDSESRDN